MSKENKMTEQELNEFRWQEERKLRDIFDEKLTKAPVTYEWQLIVTAPAVVKVGFAVISLILGSLFVYRGLSRDSVGFIITGIIFGVLFFLMARYLFSPDKAMHYKLTPLGIIYSEKDTIPDVTYTIMRGFAWFSVVVCLATVVYVGPLAFVGAGGMALLAVKFTGFKAVTKTHMTHFSGDYIIKTYKKGNTLCLFSKPIDIDYYGHFHYEEGKGVELIEELAKHIKVIKTIEVDRALDLNPYKD